MGKLSQPSGTFPPEGISLHEHEQPLYQTATDWFPSMRAGEHDSAVAKVAETCSQAGGANPVG